jgi:hypothetical protein
VDLDFKPVPLGQAARLVSLSERCIYCPVSEVLVRRRVDSQASKAERE